MMPDLGKYAATVLSAYGGALALLVALVAASLWRSARVARALREVEERVRHGRD
jgi:heme exporter protein D